MANPYFRFKQFTVWQDRCALKVGTDGVLIGGWSRIANAVRILDIGTGTGLLALIAAQRSSKHAWIDAVEIDGDSAAQAMENAAASAWSHRINVHHADVRHWEHEEPYDLVLCNPPFHAGHPSSRDPRKAAAKHDASLSLDELMVTMDRLCNDRARVSMIVPVGRLRELVALASRNGFTLSRQCFVRYLPNRSKKRVLLEFSRDPDQEVLVAEMAVEQSPGTFSAEYRMMVRDLDLKF